MKRVLVTHAIAAIGGIVFVLLRLPLPWLLGPITACLIAALLGVQMKGIPLLNNAMRSILGVAVGSTFTVALVISMASMWTTLVLVPVMVCVIGLVGVPYFQKLWGFDFPTSYYSAMPGGLQDMLLFGEEAGGDVRALSLVHATRVMVIVAALPFILKGYWGVDLSNPPGAPASSLPVFQLVLLAVAGLAGWQIAKAVGMIGASILGPMILAAVLALLGILEHRPPAEAIWLAQFYIGMVVGSKYAGITGEELRRVVVAALGFCVILLILAAFFVEVIHLLDLAPPMETLLAFAPGGQAEMTVLALIAGADMAFVIAHHVLRIVTVIVGAPFAARLFSEKPQD
ncbi:AbrB family transcriptional regulator [Octadecabacter sp. 1_MG-2023]|uniref:AbrB family transcriptional regulator n=1 Tax=unclassified Octadecabacter TaxID=196158 RepID=UPI001C08C5B2|nr:MULTISPECIES: AbrB family transcriptional regulator [unclassified Octadecabacter]MBU2994118.1 AbrB family transcriptional regulator [Octadecabacter sp. B2R22]MDO6734593.1 AbrB family transcriptional regulator [Octadecabacter sp. 1_MG-2023]